MAPSNRALLSPSDLRHLSANRFDRRCFLQLAGQSGAILALGSLASFKHSAWAHGSTMFSLGIASGDPRSDGFTIWTRLAPSPLAPHGGMPQRPVRLRYEVATDSAMRQICHRGWVTAKPEHAHNLRVHIHGLSPRRTYWYRFCTNAEDSPIGRCKTLPRKHEHMAQLRLAAVSCQDFQHGFYSAYDHLVAEDLDVVLHLGDYIYEYAADPAAVRAHEGAETRSLADYRQRYAQYRLDPALQAAHAAFPFICTFDDHEVDNNYAGASTEDDQDPKAFRARRQAAFRAFLESMPVGPKVKHRSDGVRLYRNFQYGDLANITMLDTRQYRGEQPCRKNEVSEGTDISFDCDQRLDPQRPMLGGRQERWLSKRLARSQARWNVLAQQVMLTPWNLKAVAPMAGMPIYNMDAWDGYPAARTRLLELIARHRVKNPIVLTGDIHTSWAAEIKSDPRKLQGPAVAAEFVTTSLTSAFPDNFVSLVEATLGSNPQVRFFEGRARGYTRMTIDHKRWQADYRMVSTIRAPNATIRTGASWVVQDGSSTLMKA